MAMSAGAMAGPILGGVFCDWEGLNSAFYFAAIAEFLGTVLFLHFTKNLIG
jgi:predicted MFS family arabinose efflux permease